MQMQSLLGKLARHPLNWIEPAGLGFFDVDAYLAEECEGRAHIYDEAYLANYAGLADTPIGSALNRFRADLACAHAAPPSGASPGRCRILDVGIGDGAFLRVLRSCLRSPSYVLQGVDINPAAVAYLEERSQLGSLDEPQFYDLVTFWDSLEHFRDPRVPLRAARDIALVSLPTFASADGAIRSRHFKPEEHFWYFSDVAFTRFADQEGFDVIDLLRTETALGRDGISTFVLKRRSPV